MDREQLASLRRRRRKHFKSFGLGFVKNKFQVTSLLAVGLGLLVGLIVKLGDDGTKHGKQFLNFPGAVLMNLLRMICVPLIVTSVIAGVAGLNRKSSKRVAARIIMYILASTIMAGGLGLVLVTTIEPGVDYAEFGEEKEKEEESYGSLVIRDIIKNLIPHSLIQSSFAKAQTKVVRIRNNDGERLNLLDTSLPGANIVGLVAWSIVFGLFLDTKQVTGKTTLEFVVAINEGTKSLIAFILKCVPLGLFFMIAAQILEIDDWNEFYNLGRFALVLLLGLTLHSLVILPLVYFVVSRRNPYFVILKVYPALITAFFISSSYATLPHTLKCCEKYLKIDKRVTRFVLPLITALNMNGTTLYEMVATIFITQMNGVAMDSTQLFTVILTTTIYAVGASGIPAAGALTTFFILSAANLSVKNASILVASEWLLDRFCAVVNVLANCLGVAMVYHLTKRHTSDQDRKYYQTEIKDEEKQLEELEEESELPEPTNEEYSQEEREGVSQEQI